MFGFGKNSFLGIDIGTYSIKVLEVKIKGGRPTVTNYAWISLDDLKSGNQYSFSESWPVYLKKMLKEAKIESRNAYISIPAAGALITLVEFPNIAREDLDQAIKFEAHKYIPTSLDDVVLSWDVVSITNKDNLLKKFTQSAEKTPDNASANKIQVILVAAPKDKVEKYEEIIIEAGLKLKSVEIDSFSLVRSLVGNDQGNFLIVDIGSKICNMVLVEKGVVKVNRNIDAGGRDITQAIAKNFGVDEERALEMKISGQDIFGGKSPIMVPALNTVVQEIKRVLGDYYKNENGPQLDGIILSGGTAKLKGITDFFNNSLKIKTVIGDPFSRMIFDKKLEAKINLIKPQFAVSAGLALKGAEEFMRK
ncbi:MAG: type IV pilus assembly protein PilM [Patescibacteria group bacterium]